MDQNLVHKIYQTITDDSILPSLMRDFEQLMGGYSSALMVAAEEQYLMRQTNLDPEIAEMYNTHYGDRDVWFHRAEQMKVSGVLSGLIGLADQSEFDPAYRNDILQASDCHDCLGIFLFGSAGESMGYFTIYRPFSADPFQRSDVELMKCYAGHLKHAFGLRSVFVTRIAATIPVDENEDGSPLPIYITPLSNEVSESTNAFTTGGTDNAMVIVKLKVPPVVSARGFTHLLCFDGSAD